MKKKFINQKKANIAKDCFFDQKGSSLIEVMVAVVLIVMTLTALISGMTYTMRTLAEAEFRSKATDLASECMDEIRKNRIEKGWFEFKKNPLKNALLKCGVTGAGDLTNEGFATTFTRLPSCSNEDTGVKCTVTVSWVAFKGSGENSVILEQIFEQSKY